MRNIIKPLAILGAVLVLGTGTATAATGGNFLLGRGNSASTQTLLQNTGSGPTLALSATRAGQVPIAVSAQSGKATNLNSDKLDGLDSSAFALASGGLGNVAATGRFVDIDGNGTIDPVLVAFASCPAGSRVTGGGFEVYTTFGIVISEQGDNGWAAWTITDADEDETDLVATARCYNPRGVVVSSSAALTTGEGYQPNAADKVRLQKALSNR